MISARSVTKLYGRTAVVSDVSLDVAAGEGIALSGPHGSGKTTLLRLLGSWLEPSSGTIQICGFDSRTHLWQARSRIAYAAANALVGTGLTVEEYLEFVARVRNRTAPSRRNAATPVRDALKQAQLDPASRVAALAAGQRAALSFAAVLVTPADVVLIDGVLDEIEESPRETFCHWLLEARGRGTAVVVATDDASRHSGLCNRHVRVEAGKVSELTRTLSGAED
jgi:ABC-type multidrug transport system ATPase subunit